MSTLQFDLHTHTTFSDGYDWREMAEAAADLGLEGIGFTDHCPIVPDPFGRFDRYRFATTYRDRREVFLEEAEQLDIRVIDAAEVNFDPEANDDIAQFLDEAEFEYTIGSVHTTADTHVPAPDLSETTPREIVDAYIDRQIELIESELFDVLGHLDLPQRTTELRGVMTAADYERIAAALSNSRTVPEINAGRLDRAMATVHPDPQHLNLFAEYDVSFVLGTDSHAPDQLRARVELLDELVPSLPIDIEPLPPALTV